MEISIKELSINQFEISINSSVKTIHKVTVTEEVYQNLTLGKISKEEL